MGNTKAKEIQEVDERPGLSIDIIHMPTAVAGSTFTLVFLIFLLLMCLCCCRPSLTKFCFKRVFKDVHKHLPTTQPQQQDQQPIISEPTAQPIYAAAARQAPPTHVVHFEQAPVYNSPPAIPALAYKPLVTSAPTNRIQEVHGDHDPTKNL